MKKARTPHPATENIESIAKLEQQFLENRTTSERIADVRMKQNRMARRPTGGNELNLQVDLLSEKESTKNFAAPSPDLRSLGHTRCE